MIKVSSLDFLNKKHFGCDILSQDGVVLYSSDDEITPELLLRLYFKDIYVTKEDYESEGAVVLDVELEGTLESEINDILQPSQESTEIVKQEEILKEPVPPAPIIIEVEEEVLQEVVKEVVEEEIISEFIEKDLMEFDEQEAENVSKYAIKIGEMLKLPPKKLEELRQAAYYCNIGKSKLTYADLSDAEYSKRLIEESYNILKNEMNLPEKVAQVAKYYRKDYDVTDVKLDDLVPYYSIVSIASYYFKGISKGESKEDVLMHMIRKGGNKFNIFVLHKFVSMMRSIDE